MSRKARFRSACILVALALAVSLLTGCGSQSGPEKTIQNFVTAYNKLDMNAMLDCLEPTQAEAVRSLVNIAGSLTIGVSGQDLLNIMPLFSGMSTYDATGNLVSATPELEIDVKDTKISGNAATCTVDMRVTIAGETQQQETTISLEKQDGVWYIVN